jgi:hypothetical protein
MKASGIFFLLLVERFERVDFAAWSVVDQVRLATPEVWERVTILAGVVVVVVVLVFDIANLFGGVGVEFGGAVGLKGLRESVL